MPRSFCFVLGLLTTVTYLSSFAISAETAGSAAATSVKVKAAVKVAAPPEQVKWLSDYGKAHEQASREAKMLVVYFADPKQEVCNRFDAEALADAEVRRRLAGLVCVRLPLDAKIKIDGKPVELLQHASFGEMLGLPGLAMIDMTDKKARHYGSVVSMFPFFAERPYGVEEARAMMDLPSGTLTQRTMIFAVRIHPERPASVRGQLNTTLLAEAESHSTYQADIRRQGHHFWETRFHRINAQLPDGQLAREVCAESWPGQGLVAAAIECVRCWRLSSGHWNAVSGQQSSYGYDMKRGANGIWYATGIFGR